MTLPTNIRIFPNPSAVAAGFAADFENWSQQQLVHQKTLSVVLSGGSTPKKLFQIWGEQHPRTKKENDVTISSSGTNTPSGNQSSTELAPSNWERIHFFWGDERCVAPDHPESNFGVANQLWLSKSNLPSGNIHRIRGEAEPESEARRYEGEIGDYFRKFADRGFPFPAPQIIQCNTNETQIGGEAVPNRIPPFPQFDLILLGMGADGHTASIFPNRMDLLTSSNLCAVAQHPDSGQPRVTFTGNLIKAASRIVFLITGLDKADVLRQVIEQTNGSRSFPAAHIHGPQVEFFLDQAAASALIQLWRSDG
jgi:6-phosphogluconolactonase